MTEMCSVPLSGNHTSPGRPRIWRTLMPLRAKAYRSIKGFRMQSSFYTWLHSIAVNMTINFLKKRGRRHSMSLDDVEAVRSRFPDESEPAGARRRNRQLPKDDGERPGLGCARRRRRGGYVAATAGHGHDRFRLDRQLSFRLCLGKVRGGRRRHWWR